MIRSFFGIASCTQTFSVTSVKLVAIASIFPVYSEVSFIAATIFSCFGFTGDETAAVVFGTSDDGVAKRDDCRFTLECLVESTNPVNGSLSLLFFSILVTIINESVVTLVGMTGFETHFCSKCLKRI